MEIETLDKFKKLCGKSKEFEIRGEKLTFNPLNVEYYPEYFYLASTMASKTENNKDAKMNQEELTILFKLINVMVADAYPELDVSTRSSFIGKNALKLKEILLDLNADVGQDDIEDYKDKINQMKQNVQRSN